MFVCGSQAFAMFSAHVLREHVLLTKLIPYVLDNTPPPIFNVSLSQKWGGGFYLSMYAPTTVGTPKGRAKDHVYINAEVVHVNYSVSVSSLQKLPHIPL